MTCHPASQSVRGTETPEVEVRISVAVEDDIICGVTPVAKRAMVRSLVSRKSAYSARRCKYLGDGSPLRYPFLQPFGTCTFHTGRPTSNKNRTDYRKNYEHIIEAGYGKSVC
jgi:hypothetical protein